MWYNFLFSFAAFIFGVDRFNHPQCDMVQHKPVVLPRYLNGYHEIKLIK